MAELILRNSYIGKQIYIFNVTPIKILTTFFTGEKKNTPKPHLEGKRPRLAKGNLNKKGMLYLYYSEVPIFPRPSPRLHKQKPMAVEGETLMELPISWAGTRETNFKSHHPCWGRLFKEVTSCPWVTHVPGFL